MHRANPRSILAALILVTLAPSMVLAHGTLVFPVSRVYRVYLANPANPNFPLAANAVQIDGQLSYYTWNEVSRNIPQAVTAGLPPGFDYSPWMPNGAIASAGRTDPSSSAYPRTYAGLDQVSEDWPTTPVVAGDTITVDFLATAVHSPSVWDVWMTKPTWNPAMPLTWAQMEFLGRPTATLANSHFTFDLAIPTNRSGHHVLWVAWQRNDPAGEVFISTADIEIRSFPGSGEDFELTTGISAAPSASPDVKTATQGDAINVHFESPLGGYDGTIPVLLASVFGTGTPIPATPGYPEVQIDRFNVVVAFDGSNAPGGITPLPPGGLSFSYNVGPGLAGLSVLLQAFVFAPSPMTGHVITATDGHEIRIN